MEHQFVTPPSLTQVRRDVGWPMLMRVLCIAIIEPLLQGAKVKLLASGVREENIVVQSVPGLEICFDSDSTLICINNNT